MTPLLLILIATLLALFIFHKQFARLIKGQFNQKVYNASATEAGLEQGLTELKQKHLKIQDNLAAYKGKVNVLQTKHDDLDSEIANTKAKAKALKEAGKEPKALELLTAIQPKLLLLENLKLSLSEMTEQYTQYKEQAQAVQAEIERKGGQIKATIEEAKIADMHQDLASSITSIAADDTIGAIDKTMDKVKERSAKNKATFEIAMEGNQGKIAELEADQALAESKAKDMLNEL